jgi:hypothetical protein
MQITRVPCLACFRTQRTTSLCRDGHSAEVRQFGEVTYYNDGDWVESCTALVEHFNGRMEVVRWAERKRLESNLRVAKRQSEPQSSMVA